MNFLIMISFVFQTFCNVQCQSLNRACSLLTFFILISTLVFDSEYFVCGISERNVVCLFELRDNRCSANHLLLKACWKFCSPFFILNLYRIRDWNMFALLRLFSVQRCFSFFLSSFPNLCVVAITANEITFLLCLFTLNYELFILQVAILCVAMLT